MTTLPLEIRNANAALEILGESCDFFQQFRELTENVADQARQHPDQQIICDWSFERGVYDNGFNFGSIEIPANTYKLACVDNGPGMNEATLMGPIRSLFNSGTGHDQGNFGIGAKVAGLSRHAGNGLGLLFITKEAGKEAICAVLTSQGLIQQDVLVDDEVEPWAVVPCALLGLKVPKIIKKNGHGTAVVLLGDNPSDDTVKPFDKVWGSLSGKKRVWFPQYIMRRYYSFPSNLAVSGFEVAALTDGSDFYQQDGKSVQSRPARPFSYFIQQAATLSGEIPLTGATAEWHVVDGSANSTLTTHMMTAADRSGLAVQWRGELYEREPATGLAKFGIYTGERTVFILVHPDADTVSSNATRDALYIDGCAVRGDFMRKWAGEFRSKIKDTPLGEWMAARGQKQSGDMRNRMIEVLRQVGANLKVKGFQIGASKDQVAVSASATGVPAVNPNADGASSSDHTGKGKGTASHNLPVTIDPRGQMIGSPSNTDCAPDVNWQGKEEFDEGVRTAGKYAKSGENPLGILVLNRDFKFFGELRSMLLTTVKRYSKAQDFTDEQLLAICQNLVEHAVGCQMSEAVLRAYLNAKVFGNQWSADKLDELFEPKIVTAMSLHSSTTVPYMVELFRGTAKEWLNVK